MMVARFVSLMLDTMNGLRWLLPALLVVVAVAVAWIDGNLFSRWARRGEPISLRQWITENFWILVGFGMMAYLARHYPRDPW